MRLGIIPLLDIVFKRIIGSRDHPGLTLSLINGILERIGRPLAKSVTVTNPWRAADFIGDKEIVVDVRVRDEFERDFQIEMQVQSNSSTPDRMLDNWARIYTDQLGKGGSYSEHRPVISIWMLDANLFPGDDWLHVIEIRDQADGARFGEDFLIVAIELRKRARLPDFKESLMFKAGIDEWLYLFVHGQDIDPESQTMAKVTPEIREAVEIMRVFTKREAEKYRYEKRLEYLRVQRDDMADAKKQGLDEGIALAKREAARNFKQLGVSVAIISTATGLPKEIVENL